MKLSSIMLSIVLLGTTGLYGQCDFGAHDTGTEGAWLSCEISSNPNDELQAGHWIMYDLGEPHHLFDSHFWNYNRSGLTGRGVRNCRFDVSNDGVTWTYWGNTEMPEAPGNNDYTGVTGPYFDGVVARYLLLTIESNWNDDECSGFAEIRIDIEEAEVSVEEAPEMQMSAYPNPSSDVITIRHYSGSGARLQVYQSNGALVLEEQLLANTHILDVRTWQAGLYVASITDASGKTGQVRLVVGR